MKPLLFGCGGLLVVGLLLVATLFVSYAVQFYIYEPFPIPEVGWKRDQVWASMVALDAAEGVESYSNCAPPQWLSGADRSALYGCSHWDFYHEYSGQSLVVTFDDQRMVKNGEYHHRKWDNLIFPEKEVLIR